MSRLAHYDSSPADPGNPPEVPVNFRSRLVARVKSQIGVRGATPESDVYFRDAAPVYAEGSKSGKHWCGIFCLWALRQEGLTDATWRDGVGFLGHVLGWGAITKNPKPGDICYVDSPHQHHAMVCAVTEDSVHTIDGNSGARPGVVARQARAKGKRGVTYFSISRLLRAAEERERADTDPAPPPEGAV